MGIKEEFIDYWQQLKQNQDQMKINQLKEGPVRSEFYKNMFGLDFLFICFSILGVVLIPFYFYYKIYYKQSHRKHPRL